MAGDRENFLDNETHNSEAAALRKKIFCEKMAEAESEMKANPEAWSDYIEERDTWLNANLGTP